MLSRRLLSRHLPRGDSALLVPSCLAQPQDEFPLAMAAVLPPESQPAVGLFWRCVCCPGATVWRGRERSLRARSLLPSCRRSVGPADSLRVALRHAGRRGAGSADLAAPLPSHTRGCRAASAPWNACARRRLAVARSCSAHCQTSAQRLHCCCQITKHSIEGFASHFGAGDWLVAISLQGS